MYRAGDRSGLWAEEPDVIPEASGPPWGRGREVGGPPGRSSQVASLVPEAYFTSLAPRWLRDRGGGGSVVFFPALAPNLRRLRGGGRPKLREPPVPGSRRCFGCGWDSQMRREGRANMLKTREPVRASRAAERGL